MPQGRQGKARQGPNGYLWKIDPAKVASYVTDANTQYRSMVQYDASTLYALVWTSSAYYFKPLTTALVIGAGVTISFTTSYNLQDAVLATDNNIAICGVAPTTRAFVSKVTTSGTTLWTATSVLGGNPQIMSIIRLTDGSFVIADSHDTGMQRPYMAQVTNDGTMTWENVYTLSAYAIYTAGVIALDDYSVTLMGGLDNGAITRPYYLKAQLVCPPNCTLNGGSTACIIGIVFTKVNFV